MPAKTYDHLECPTCHGQVQRLRRREEERGDASRSTLRRYSCQSAACGWEGLLPRRVRRPRKLMLRMLVRRVGRSALPATLVLAMAVAVGAAAWKAGLFMPAQQRGYALGEHHEGEPLPKAHGLSLHHAGLQHASLRVESGPSAPSNPVASAGADAVAVVPAAQTSTLALRYSCVWGDPGRNPYRGTVEQALRSAALPEEVVKQVALQVKNRQPVDRLEIRNDGVHALASGRVFDAQNIALTYGKTLCLGSRVNFKAGHMEPAALYEATTADGRVVAVMVPEVCGNVSVLGQTDDSARSFQVNNAVAGASDTQAPRLMPAVLQGAAGALVAGSSKDIPEPGTLACVLAALGALFYVRWKRRSR